MVTIHYDWVAPVVVDFKGEIMSYCRWSTNHGNCDLYCYESAQGFITHIAETRLRTWVKIFRWLTDSRFKTKWGRIRSTRFFLFSLPHWLTHKKINLPLNGESFTDETEGEMFDRIKYLHGLGYKVPESLLAFPPKEIAPE